MSGLLVRVSVLYEMLDQGDDRDVVNFSSQGRADIVFLYLPDISTGDSLQNTCDVTPEQ